MDGSDYNSSPMSTARHFTATGFVVYQGAVLLHWHRKVMEWLPPGGHIEENEDPVQAALREIAEETGVSAEVVPTGDALALEYPAQVQPPFTIMVEDIHDPVDGYHQHIDMIYFCRLVGPAHLLKGGWLWVAGAELESGAPLEAEGAPAQPPPEDVRLLALKAIDMVSG